VRACVRARAIRASSARACALSARATRYKDRQSLPSHYHCFDLVNFTFPHFTHTGAPQCLYVGVGAVRACVRVQSARYPRALCAIRTASIFLVIITVLSLLISLFPTLLTQALQNAYVWVCSGVRACVRTQSARYPRALCAFKTDSLFLVIITVLSLLISLFPTLLTQAPLNAYVWVWGGVHACVRAQSARYTHTRAR
jgi:hypothetical protein